MNEGDEGRQISLLWDDPALDRAVKIQDLLLVKLGLRPASLLLIPRSLPEAEKLGEEIDSIYRYAEERGHLPGAPLWRRVPEMGWRRLTGKLVNPLRYRSSLAREAFRTALSGSPGYAAIRRWTDALGLERVETAIRPTIDELYVVAEEANLPRLTDVMKMRRQIRVRAASEVREGEAASLRAFPEERDQRFLESLGRLLGYPECCVVRYAEERVGGLNVEERASRQLQEALPSGTYQDTAYFTRDFFPCQPDCPRAAAKGRTADRLLLSLERDGGPGGLADAYRDLMKGNRRIVLKYPEIIKQHERRMSGKSRMRKETRHKGAK